MSKSRELNLINSECKDGEKISYYEDEIIVKEPMNLKIIPVCCDVCEFAISNIVDIQRYHEYQCCAECLTLWAEPNRERWKKGWRPTERQIIKERKRRNSFPLFLDLK